MAKKGAKGAGNDMRVNPDAMQAFTEPEPLDVKETLELVHGEGRDEDRLQKLLGVSRRKKASSPSKKRG